MACSNELVGSDGIREKKKTELLAAKNASVEPASDSMLVCDPYIYIYIERERERGSIYI